MNDWLRECFEKDQLYHLYQPIWDLTNWNILGYESLVRVRQMEFIDIQSLFQTARNENYLYELDTFLIENSIVHFPRIFFRQRLLFLNIFPSTLCNTGFRNYLIRLVESYPFIQKRIVFELNETNCEDWYWGANSFKETISMLKNFGFYIALDDVGSGTCSLEKILELCPDYIKLDRQYAAGLARNRENQQFIIDVMKNLPGDTHVILEGIEKEEDLAKSKLLKIPIGQGFLLGEPQSFELEWR